MRPGAACLSLFYVRRGDVSRCQVVGQKAEKETGDRRQETVTAHQSLSSPRKRGPMWGGITIEMPAYAGMTVKRVQFLFPVACPLFPSLLLSPSPPFPKNGSHIAVIPGELGFHAGAGPAEKGGGDAGDCGSSGDAVVVRLECHVHPAHEDIR